MTLVVEAIAYHGWGFDSNCWQPWQALFAQSGWNFQAFDRGYFQPAHSPEFTNQVAIHVLLIHSYGLHLCPIEQFAQADLLVSFNSFLTFHAEDKLLGKRSRRVVNQMMQSFQENPNLVLETFYQNCGYPRSIPATQPEQRELLLSDLANLNIASFDPIHLLGIPKILIFQGLQDQIVAPAIGQTLFDQVREDSQYCEYFEFEDAGHALPFTATTACWDTVRQALIQDESLDALPVRSIDTSETNAGETDEGATP